VPSAREIRKKLREREDEERRRREDAVVAVGDAGAIALKAREDNDAALRAAFEAALRTRDSDRVTKLRAEFDAALADDPRVIAAERDAGRAVLAAAAFRVGQVELAELTELRVEDLRRWTQMARQAEHSSPPASESAEDRPTGGTRRHADRVERAVTGFAVVASPERDGEQHGEQTGAADSGEVDAAAG
jgi:hypothetical protein